MAYRKARMLKALVLRYGLMAGLACLIGSTSLLWPVQAQGTDRTFQAVQTEHPYHQLHRLSQLQPEALQDWTRKHPSEALAMLREVVVDVYASPWLGLEPFYPESRAMLPVLAKALNQPAVLDAACGWSRSRADWWRSDPLPACQTAPGAGQLDVLRHAWAAVQDARIEALPNPETGISLRAFLYSDEVQEPWSERGNMQLKLLESIRQRHLQKRLELLNEVLAWSQQLPAHELQGHLLLMLALTYAEASRLAPEDQLPGMNHHQAVAKSQELLKRAQAVQAEIQSPSLEVRLHLFQAFESAHLKQAELAVNKLPSGALRQQLELELADTHFAWSVLDAGDEQKAFSIYHRLLREGELEIQLAVIERLLHIQRREDLLLLRKSFDAETHPDKRALLVGVFPLLDQGPQLFALLQQERQPKLRHVMVNLLANSYQDSGDRYRDFRLLEPLINDPDPDIRWQAAAALSKIDEPAYQARVLSWIDSSDAGLLIHALSEAHNQNRRDLLPQILSLIQHPDEGIQSYAVVLAGEWGSATDLPVLTTALPKTRGQGAEALRLLIARYHGSQAWLAELLRQNQTPMKYDALAGSLQMGLHKGLISRSDIEALLKHTNPHIREQAGKALEPESRLD